MGLISRLMPFIIHALPITTFSLIFIQFFFHRHVSHKFIICFPVSFFLLIVLLIFWTLVLYIVVFIGSEIGKKINDKDIYAIDNTKHTLRSVCGYTIVGFLTIVLSIPYFLIKSIIGEKLRHESKEKEIFNTPNVEPPSLVKS
ncbi:MAG: hypothetical protein ISR98_01580 [Parcubacteria group bacterium]|nr:hypothetical protein [Parcubacteria group bacterium]